MIRYLVFLFSLLFFSGCTQLNSDFLSSNSNIDADVKTLSAQSESLDPNVAKLALTAYHKARQKGVASKQVLTIIDYSKPSTEPRFWVVDLPSKKIMFEELVAHGKNSGGNFATSFSDRTGSLKSSIGLYVTQAHPYQGQHGYSLRLVGLEKGFNDKAFSRAIVVHGAPYVSEDYARANGRLGLSWGCPALNPSVVRPVIEKIKGGAVVFAYYPDPRWEKMSEYLRA